jgi:tRNA pseudouridine55 synthase
VIRFGIVTETQDLDGRVLAERPTDALDETAIRTAARRLVGASEQIPPMVSAIKVGGRRLHALARRGVTIDRAPRRIVVESWEWLGFELPEARFRIRCSGGTYVRTLAHDLGAALGTGAALGALRRLRSEPFGLERSVGLRDLQECTPAELLARGGTPLDEALGVLPAVALDPSAAEVLGAGGRPSVAAAGVQAGGGPRSVVFRDQSGHALALGELIAAAGGEVLACPRVVFPWAVRTGPRTGRPHIGSQSVSGLPPR